MLEEMEVFLNVFQKQQTSTQMLENLINDLIDLAKIENNKFSLNKEYCDLTETIHSTLELLQFQANEKNIEFNCIIDK